MPFPQTTFVLLILVVYFTLRSVGGNPFEALTREDHWGENLQFAMLFYLATLFWGLASVFREFKFQSRLMVFLAVVSFLVCLEEISWGQRLLDWSWPDLQQHNHQREINIHNLIPLKDRLWPYYGACLVLLLFPFVVWGPVAKKFLRAWPRFFAWDSVLAPGVLLVMYLFLEQRTHEYFYETSELGLFGILVLQARQMYAYRTDLRRPSFLPFALLTAAMTYHFHGWSFGL